MSKISQEHMSRTLEAMNVIYLCSEIINMAWMINKDLRFADPNMNNFNKKIGQFAQSIKSGLKCVPKDDDMAQERAIELYRALNNLSQYNTEDLKRYNDITEEEILKINA